MSIQPSNQPDGPLTDWFKESLGGFYELSDSSITEENFKSVFSKKFLAESRVYLDHEQVTLDDFQKRLLESKFAFAKAEVKWKEVVEQGPQDADGNEVRLNCIHVGFVLNGASRTRRLLDSLLSPNR